MPVRLVSRSHQPHQQRGLRQAVLLTRNTPNLALFLTLQAGPTLIRRPLPKEILQHHQSSTLLHSSRRIIDNRCASVYDHVTPIMLRSSCWWLTHCACFCISVFVWRVLKHCTRQRVLFAFSRPKIRRGGGPRRLDQGVRGVWVVIVEY